jgi:hypothetical protein
MMFAKTTDAFADRQSTTKVSASSPQKSLVAKSAQAKEHSLIRTS